MEKKYILTDEPIEHFGHTLHRIQAVKDFGTISAGTLGGYIESEGNLDHIGNAWVADNARVDGNAWVTGDAWVSGSARVSGDARVSGSALVSGSARVSGNVRVSGDARVLDNARVSGSADYTTVHGFGRYFRTTTFFKCSDGQIRTCCGCFYGTLDEFREKVKKTHGDSKFAKEYLAIADLMELHFKED